VKNGPAIATVLAVILTIELVRRDGLTSLKVIGQAATGELVLK
jgi:hypothetical protein